MHDNYIVNYNVNLIEKELIIRTIQSLDDVDKHEEIIYFSEVLTHSFECILQYNQILDIEECEIDKFISDNKVELEEMRAYCWPIRYKELRDLKEYLISNRYKCISLYSSYGMSGWVLAKSYCIKDAEYPMEQHPGNKNQ